MLGLNTDRRRRAVGRRDAVSPLVRSGLTELAASALSGWVYTFARQQPALAPRVGIRSVARIRQWHLDMAMLGTAAVACGVAVPDAPKRTQDLLMVGTWTNATLFLPLAIWPDLDSTLAYKAAATASFAATTAGFCGFARFAWRG